ncbi:MbcA/ParS/Xre antitoxin family protein [Variovorax guangxiensis]|uniref:MbcA/ParS/Xre antitoxin family protein n=1 Tax=Variovorax guangxiensis TaxID=1775474 RepID=UPI0028625BE8|nr:MbcA/ParS/Xre antitoxin family protein [Variovorax guangxiensis]MDR6860543.1 uncharacterized protein (DUF2384 family) [Variovorax guangxiensis]
MQSQRFHIAFAIHGSVLPMPRHTPPHQPSPAAKRLIPAPQGVPVDGVIAGFIEEAAQDAAEQSRAVHELTARLEGVFISLSDMRAVKRKGSAKRKGTAAIAQAKVFVATHELGHHRMSFNVDLAATLAARPVSAAAVREWFDATGIELRKDLFQALHVHPSKLSRAGPETEMDASVTERMLRHSDLLVRAAEVFGEDGKTWLTKPHDLLGGKTPMEFAGNEFGGAKVRAMLNAIEYGGVV